MVEGWKLAKEQKIKKYIYITGMLGVGGDDLQKTWKEHYEDLYNVDKDEQIAISVCGSDGARKDNNINGNLI